MKTKYWMRDYTRYSRPICVEKPRSVRTWTITHELFQHVEYALEYLVNLLCSWFGKIPCSNLNITMVVLYGWNNEQSKASIPTVLINSDVLHMIDNTLGLHCLDFTDVIWWFRINLLSIRIPNNLVAATRGNKAWLANSNPLPGGRLRNNM